MTEKEKPAFREGSARAYAFDLLQKGIEEEKIVKKLVEKFPKMSEINAKGKVRVAKTKLGKK